MDDDMTGFSYTVDGTLLGAAMGGDFIGPAYVPVRPPVHRDYVQSPVPSGTDDAAAYADRVFPAVLSALRVLSSARSALQGALDACPGGEVCLMLGDALFALDHEVRDVMADALVALRGGKV